MSYAIAGKQQAPTFQPPTYKAPTYKPLPCPQKPANNNSSALAVAININLPAAQEKPEKKSGKAGKNGKAGKHGKNGKAGKHGKNSDNQEYFSPLHQCQPSSPCNGGAQTQDFQQLVGLLLSLLGSGSVKPSAASCGASAGVGGFLDAFSSPRFF